jgi:ABC-type transport system involved in multi-copper enzyme maturation permease subunit
MIGPAILRLVRDTFRQAGASRVSWLMLGVSALGIAFCLSVRVDGGRSLRPPGTIELYGADHRPLSGVDTREGHLNLAFGGIRLGLFRDAAAQVHFLQAFMARWMAGAAGTLLALVLTAGLLPEFLQPGASAVLLTKPIPRWALLLGRYLGVVAFVGAQASVFVLGTCLALGIRTGIWAPGYLACLPLFVFHFAVFYAASVLLAVTARSTAACAFGSVAFWTLCFTMNQGRHAAVVHRLTGPDVQSTGFRWAREAAYWILPKPADLTMLLDRALRSGEHFGGLPEFEAVQRVGAFHPVLSATTTALFALALLMVAAREFALKDY